MFATMYTERYGQEMITFLDTKETFTWVYGQWVSMQTWKPIEYPETHKVLNTILAQYHAARKLLE